MTHKVIAHRFKIETSHRQAQVIHVAAGTGWQGLPCQQIDECGADSQMRKRQFIAAPLQLASQNLAIELNGAVKVSHPDNDMIDSRDFHTA